MIALLVIGSIRLFDQGPLILGNLICRHIPRSMLRPINIRLRPHTWIRIQKSARHDPELPIAAQLRHGRTATSAKPTRESRVLRRVHKAFDEVFSPRPPDRILWKCHVRGMNGAGRFLTRTAVTIEELKWNSGNLEGDFAAQTRPCDQLHSIWSNKEVDRSTNPPDFGK